MSKPKKQSSPVPETRDDPEVAALASAYYAITSQPREAWPRMVEWLNARIASDLERSA